MMLMQMTIALLCVQATSADAVDAPDAHVAKHNEVKVANVATLEDVRPLMAYSTTTSEPALGAFAQSPAFGTQGTRRWQIHGGYAIEPGRTQNMIGLGGASISYFFLDNISIDAELNGMYVNQTGSDAIAGNFNLIFRWHFINEESWSLFADAGAGLLLANEPVPDTGSRFNFTPQVGGGVSFDLRNDTRLITGLRWLHISNAGMYSNNPGRENVYAYTGLNFGF